MMFRFIAEIILASAIVPNLVNGSAALAKGEIMPNRYYTVPSFSTTELQRGKSYGRLAEALATTGLIALSSDDQDNDDDYRSVRDNALGGLCQCAAEEDFAQLEGADSILLRDGQTVRSSLATATVGFIPLPLTSQLPALCGAETAQAMDYLRDQVAEASSVFIRALDKLLAHERRQDVFAPEEALLRNSYGGSYHSVSSIVQASSNLEHFHVYSKQEKSNKDDTGPTTTTINTQTALQMHTDAGLFLAFVPAHGCSSSSSTRDKSFYLQDSNGATMEAVFPPNSIAIMLGTGAEHWLQTPESLPLRATRHSVDMDAGDSRAWYGMMHLVPEVAIVDSSSQHNHTFGEMREAMILKSNTRSSREFKDDALNDQLEDISIGCGYSDSATKSARQNGSTSEGSSVSTSPRRRLQHVENAGACNNVTNFYCWMSCLDIPNVDQAEGYINEDYRLYCVDPSVVAATGKVSEAVEPCDEAGVTGLAMNSNCMGMWQPIAPGVPPQTVIVESSAKANLQEPFCYGGTSMYMDGFNWVGSTCPIYLFPSIVLNSAGALVAACVFTIAFGIALEWVIQRRRVTVSKYSPGYQRLCVSASFYGVQLTMGYSIMLVVMIYSIPLFLSVVIGIVSGHVLFSAPDAIAKEYGLCCVLSSKEKMSDVESDKMADTNGLEESCCGKSTGGYDSTSRSDRDCEAPKSYLAVAEGSTPCCQHVL